MLQRLVILGAGGFAREVLDVIDAINAVEPQYECLGYIIDPQYGTVGEIINDLPVLGDFSWFATHPDVSAICGVGAPEVRRNMIQKCQAYGIQYPTLIHPSAILTRWVKLGSGNVITAGCIFTNQIVVGDHVHVNLDCTIGHDVILEDYVTLAPGVHVSGNVHLSAGSYIGTGANILEKRTIGRWAVVGAGSTVVKDVEANTTVVGVPAQVIKSRPEGWHLL